MPPFLPYLIGPLVGAVIGYFTNYLAVRMLFRPLKEHRIGGLRLPFTPGIIPKRRAALAKTLGRAVGMRLLTGDDLCALLLPPETAEKIGDAAASFILGSPERPLSDRLAAAAGEERLAAAKDALDAEVTEALLSALASLDLGALIVSEGGTAIRETAPSLVSMFLTDRFLESLSQSIGERVHAYLAESGAELIRPAVAEKTTALLASDAESLLGKIGVGREDIRTLAASVVRETVGVKAAEYLAGLDIAGEVERKINAMDMRELEHLILSVMKHELNAVVNLGALIGFLLGFLTAFF